MEVGVAGEDVAEVIALVGLVAPTRLEVEAACSRGFAADFRVVVEVSAGDLVGAEEPARGADLEVGECEPGGSLC